MTVGNGPTARKSVAVQSGHGDPAARAARLLVDQPDMTGADLGRELGVSPRHGLRLKKRAEMHKSDNLAVAAG